MGVRITVALILGLMSGGIGLGLNAWLEAGYPWQMASVFFVSSFLFSMFTRDKQ